jgi:hypothetical protein
MLFDRDVCTLGRKGGRLPKLYVCKIQEGRIIGEKNTYAFHCKHFRKFSRNLMSKFVPYLVTYIEELELSEIMAMQYTMSLFFIVSFNNIPF